MAVLQKTYDSVNPYESIQNKYKNNSWFNQERWNRAARTGNLALESSIMQNSSKLPDYDKFIEDNHLDSYANDINDQMFYFAVSNELYGDKSEIKEWGGEEVGNLDNLGYQGLKDYLNELGVEGIYDLYNEKVLNNFLTNNKDKFQYDENGNPIKDETGYWYFTKDGEKVRPSYYDSNDLKNMIDGMLETVNQYNSFEEANKSSISSTFILSELGLYDPFRKQFYTSGTLKKPTYEMTEYEYNRKLMQDWINYDNALIQEAKEKAEWNAKPWYEKAWKTVVDAVGSFMSGVDNFVGGIADLGGSLINATLDSTIDGKNFGDSFKDSMSNLSSIREGNHQAFFEGTGVTDGSILRDENGNYTTVGQWIAGAAETIGEMFGAWAFGGQLAFLSTGGAATSATINVGKLSVTTGKIGYGLYYTSSWSSRMSQRFNNPEYDSMPTWQIILETGLQTLTDIAIEKGLGYIFGSSVTDKILGASNKLSKVARTIAGGLNKLPKALQVAAKIGINVGHEILEENIQDMVAVGVSSLMGVITGNFGTEEITWQSILDTTMITAFTSALMVSANIVATPRVTIGINPETNTKVKLGKLTSWLYNEKLQDLLNTYEQALSSSNLNEVERARVFENMQFAATNMIQLFTGLGTERVTQAMKLLQSIDAYQKSHELNQMLNAAQLRESGILTEEEYYALPESYRQANNLVYTQSREEALSAYVDSIVDQVHELQNELASNIITKKYLKSKSKDKLGHESQQTVAEDLNDADISTLHSIVTGDKNSDVPDKNKSEKQIEVAQDVLKHTKKKAVVLTDGNNVVESEDAIFVPSNYAENVESGTQVVQSVAEQGIVTALANSLDDKIVKKLLNFYKTTLSDKRKATKKNALRALLFDQNFLNAITPFFTKELYVFAANIKTVLEASAGKNLQDTMYRKVIGSIVGRFRISMREYLVNVQYADLSQATELFTSQELDEIKRSRWSFDIANTFIEYGYNMLTDAEKAIVDKNINYLTVDEEVKNKILQDAHSESKFARQRAVKLLNSQYSNLYYASYNDSIYFRPNTPARSYFNEFMKANNFNLMDIRLNRYNSKLVDKMNNSVDENNNPYTNIESFIKDEFRKFTNGNYDVDIVRNQAFVKQSETNTLVNQYASNMEQRYQDYSLTKEINQRVEEESGSLTVSLETKEIANKALSDIVDGSKINSTNLAYLDIDTIIQNPLDYLKPEMLKRINSVYGDTSTHSVYLYLNDYLLANYNDIAIARDNLGGYRLVGFKYAKDILNTSIKNTDPKSKSIVNKYGRKGKVKLTAFVNKDILPPRAQDVTVEIHKKISLKDKTQGYYDSKSNSIVIFTNQNDAEVRFAILHEVQHLLDHYNGLSSGGDVEAFNVSNELLKDFEKHLPTLFKGKNKEQKKDMVRWLIYENLEGELRANRLSNEIDFVPMLITQEIDGSYTLTTSWGTTHKHLTNRLNEMLTFRDYDTNEQVNIINRDDYKAFYDSYENAKYYTHTEKEKTRYNKAVNEILNNKDISKFVNQELASKPISDDVRNKVVQAFDDSELWVKSIEALKYEIAPDMSYEEFVDTPIPFVRIQINDKVYDTPLLSASIGEHDAEALISEYFKSNIAGLLLVADIKPKDLIGYIPNELHEALVTPKSMKNAKKYYVKRTYDGVKVITNYDPKIDTTMMDFYKTKVVFNYELKPDLREVYDTLSRLLNREISTYKLGDELKLNTVILPDGNVYTTNTFVIKDAMYRLLNTRTDGDLSIHLESRNNNLTIFIPSHLTIKAINSLNSLVSQIEKQGYNKITLNSIDSNAVKIVDFDTPLMNQIRQYAKDLTFEEYDAGDYFENRMIEFSVKRTDENSDITDKPKKSSTNIKRGTPKRANSDRIFVSKAKYGNTNAKAFVGRNMPLDVLNFIIEADKSKLPSELWTKIENGTLNFYDIHEYFRKTHNLDDYTFDLIKRNFWPDSPFRNNKELIEFTQLKLRYFYALSVALQKAGMDVDLHEPKTFEQIMTIYQQLSANTELAKKLDNASLHYDDVAIRTKDGMEYQPLNTDENHLRVTAMQYYDGTIDSAVHVAAIARAIAMSYKYSEAWNTADVKKSVSLDQSTKGHKADDDSSGTYSDIISNDIRYARDTIDEALTQQYESNTRNQNIELLAQYYGDKLRKKYIDYESWSDSKKRVYAANIIKKIVSMTDVEFETMVKKVMARQLGTNYTEKGIENKNVGKPVNKRKNLIAQIKNRASQIRSLRSEKQWKNVPDNYKKYFDDEGNLKQEYYANVETSPDQYGNFPKLHALFVDLNSLAQGLKNGDFTTKKGLNAFLQAQKYKSLYQEQKKTNRKLKAQLSLVDTSGRLIVTSQTKEFKLNADVEIPKKLRIMLDAQYDYEADSKQQFITDPDEKHAAYSTKKFFEVNADTLNNLTSTDAEEIIRFYSTALITDGTDMSLKKFEVVKIYLGAYILQQVQEGRLDLDSYYIEQAEQLLKSVSLAASIVSNWRNVMWRVNPNKVIIETISRRLGVDLSEEDAETLASATKTGDIKTIVKAQREVSRKLLYEYKSIGDTPTSRKSAVNKTLKALGLKEGISTPILDNIIRNPTETLSENTLNEIKKKYGSLSQKSVLEYVQDVMVTQTQEIAAVKRNNKYIFVNFDANKSSRLDKILTWQKAMMLSSPATIVRNQISNVTLRYGNKLADIVGKLAFKGIKKIAKVFGKNTFTKTFSTEQLNLANIKLSEHRDVSDFVQKELVDSGLMAMIEDVASKYDTRSTKKKTGTEAITDMIVEKLISDITRGNTYNHDIMNRVVHTIFSWQSDTRFINKAAKEYITKLLVASNIDITKGLTDNVMNQIAEGYKLAAFDYMHKTNIFSKLENSFRERNPKAYLAYKMLFPFVPSSWNWFIEGVNWSPVGIFTSIYKLCTLERQINKIENARQKGDRTIDPRLVEYTIQRNLGKGIIGSFLWGLGATLCALGIIVVDDDDDRLKIKIGDVYFDIANIFGSSSLLVGAALMQPSSGSITSALESAFNQFIDGSVFNDIAQMFSYNKSLFDVLLEMPTDLLGTFVPNFLKTVNKLFYSFELEYSDGFLGNLEYLLSSSIPFLAYAFPKKIDPFTGEVQSRYGLSFGLDFLTDLINVASPIRVKPHKVSDAELEAILLGLNKQQLTGKYEDIGQVDVQKLNEKYGQLNKQELNKLMKNQQRYRIQLDDGSYRDLLYVQMTDEQKSNVIDRIMSNNATYAKIYVWTQSGGKYYTTSSKLQELKKLGIRTNVYLETKKLKGFVKNGKAIAA